MKKVFNLLLAVLGILMLSGCQKERRFEVSNSPLPDYSHLLQGGSVQRPTLEENEEYELPVRVYMDNTGSMQAFIFDEDMKCNADPSFVRLMRSFRDMERVYYKTCFFTICQDAAGKRDWYEYGAGVYDDFQKPEFYFSWLKTHDDGNPNGPLSLLYLEDGGLDPAYINVVMTDLAEQNVNNTQLAQEIQKMCMDNDCEAYLFAFWFDYHGNAQVADPNRMNDIIERRVDGKRPYYVIITGPARHIETYIDGFLSCLDGQQMHEGIDFYLASSRLEWNDTILNPENIIFSETASYEDIKEETKTGIPSELSKNIQLRQEPGLMPGEKKDSGFRFFYEKTEGASKKQNDWRLNFQIPLEDFENPNIEYSIAVRCYYPELIFDESESAPDHSNAAENDDSQTNDQDSTEKSPVYEWREVPAPHFMMDVEQLQVKDSGQPQEVYQIHMTGRPDPRQEEDSVLLIFTVTKKETMAYSVPSWLSDFDSGNGDDYFQKTYNLKGFYDVLFGYRSLRTKDGEITSTLTYAEIPILITGLRGGK